MTFRKSFRVKAEVFGVLGSLGFLGFIGFRAWGCKDVGSGFRV